MCESVTYLLIMSAEGLINSDGWIILMVGWLVHCYHLKINFSIVLLSAPLRSKGGRLCFATVYLFFFYLFFFYSPFVLRNYSTDSHLIFRNCVFWCSLSNPVVLKFF